MPWLLLLALPALLMVPVAYALWRGLSMPRARPEEVRAPPGGSVLLCLGDSITHGHIGASWVETLRDRLGPAGWQVANGGINGQQAWNIARRLDAALECRPDMAVLLIGSNDVMAADRPDRAASYRARNKLPRTPDLAWSIGCLRKLVPVLRAAVPRVGLCTIPPLGDDPEQPIAAFVAQYNDVVRELAEEHDCVLLDVHAALAPLLSPERTRYRGAQGEVVSAVGRAVLAHYLRGASWDAIGAAAGFGATVEGIHLTDRAADRVADLVQGFVQRTR